MPRIGGKWRFKSADPTGKLEVNRVRDFQAHGEIVELDPPRLLAYTWIANWHDKPERSSPGSLGAHAQRKRHSREGHAQQPC